MSSAGGSLSPDHGLGQNMQYDGGYGKFLLRDTSLYSLGRFPPGYICTTVKAILVIRNSRCLGGVSWSGGRRENSCAFTPDVTTRLIQQTGTALFCVLRSTSLIILLFFSILIMKAYTPCTVSLSSMAGRADPLTIITSVLRARRSAWQDGQ